MISIMNSNNLSFIGKILIIVMAVFFILNNLANVDKYQSILLAIIVAVSIIIIENIFYINYMATDPLNCEQCKITDINYTNDPNNIVKSNLVNNPENVVAEYSEEPFSSNLSELISNFSKNFSDSEDEHKKKLKEKEEQVEQLLETLHEQKDKNPNAPKVQILKSMGNNVKFRCVKLPNNLSDDDLDSMNAEELRNLVKNKLGDESNLVSKLEAENAKLKDKNDLMEKNEQIADLKNELKAKQKIKAIGTKSNSDPFNNGSSDSTEGFANLNDVINDSEDEGEMLNKYIKEQNKKNKNLNKKKVHKEKNELPNDVQQKINKVKKQINENKKSSKTEAKKGKAKAKAKSNKRVKQSENESLNSNESNDSGNSEDSGTSGESIESVMEGVLENPEVPNTLPVNSEGQDISYDANYVEYQQDGLQKEANRISAKQNIFKMGIGNPNIVRPYIKDGEKYYDMIFSESTNAPTMQEAQNNELKYGYYNYIGPLNKGMINKDYTFISPENWYPIPPHPPICVTNKSCTTCPIQMTDGKDYMPFATVEDFDKARRFTGSMNINTEYVKKVLNNPDGF